MFFQQGSQSGLQSPPVPACRNQLRAAGAYKDVFSELSALRQQLRSEQKRLECRLQQDDWEELDSPMSIRSQERPAVDVFDMARLRLQAPVRRPSSRSVDPRNLRNHESYRLKHADGESRLGFCKEAKLEETNQRIRDYGDSYHHFSDQRSTVLDDYLDLSPPHQTNHLRGDSRGSERDSQLRSEITFIDSLDDATPVPHTPKLDEVHQLSARERRRLSKQHAQVPDMILIPPLNNSVSVIEITKKHNKNCVLICSCDIFLMIEVIKTIKMKIALLLYSDCCCESNKNNHTQKI
uniref:Uncharacterized protein n=1 Tax=Oryzias melastigma TaxID=30732 RepID=A0A3B3CJL3_ORYME